MKKIALFRNSSNIGGIETQVLNISTYLKIPNIPFHTWIIIGLSMAAMISLPISFRNFKEKWKYF